MKKPKILLDWTAQVGQHFPQLSHPEMKVLSEYSFAMAVTKEAGQQTVSAFLGQLLGDAPNTVRQRLRELTYEASAKRGRNRREIDVETCFAPLLRWLLTELADEQAVLALDPTYLGNRFIILSISFVYRGTAIPVAWHVQATHQAGDWHSIWIRLLDNLAPTLAAYLEQGHTVWMLTDRGLQSKRLFEALVQRGYHPLMRIRAQGYFQAEQSHWQALEQIAVPEMTPQAYSARCFKQDTIEATLMVQWDALYQEPCLVLSDVAPQAADFGLYAYRTWIEAGFKDLKRGGLRWEQTKMRHPKRVERLWLVMAVALIYLLKRGNQAENKTSSPSAFDPPQHTAGLSLLKWGWVTLLAQLIHHAEHQLTAIRLTNDPCRNLKPSPI